MSIPPLRGQRIYLRPPSQDDIADRLASGREREYVRLCGGDPRNVEPLTIQEATAWLERMSACPNCWSIQVDGRCVGTTRLHHLDRENRRARYAIGIFDARARGLGYGTEATRLVLRYAFETLGLHRVDLRVLAFNRQAIACYERCGFVQEGVEREGVLIAGEWQSDVWMSILESEYRLIAPK